MTCRECVRARKDTHWCWICGELIPGGANGVNDHYGSGKCSGKQFTTVGAEVLGQNPFRDSMPCIFFVCEKMTKLLLIM